MKERRFITPLALYAKRPLPPPPGNWGEVADAAKVGKAAKAAERARLQPRLGGFPGPRIDMLPLSGTSCTSASYALLSIQLTSARLALRTPKARIQADKRRQSRQLQTLTEITPLRRS